MSEHEYFLERRMFRRLSTRKVLDPAWTRFSFLTCWQHETNAVTAETERYTEG